MKICKLGTSPDACELLAREHEASEPDEPRKIGVKGVPRRRCKPRNTSGDYDSDWQAISYFATDPNRFAGLPEHFFWLDTLQVPDKPVYWYIEHAEEVFKRRQAERHSYDQLADFFGKSKPTMIRVVAHYLETHPGAVDEVALPAGGKRGKRIDVGPIADEVRRLWWDGVLVETRAGKKIRVRHHDDRPSFEGCVREDGRNLAD